MARNKQELKELIEELPIFEKRDVQTRNGTEESVEEWTTQKELAICSIKTDEAFAYVSPNYKLIQFKDIFTPMLESIPEEVKGYLVNYGGFAMLKVFPEIESLKEGNSRFGLVAMNSVDLSSSIVVKFCVEHNELQFTIPTKIAGLKKSHVGKVDQLIKDYISMVGKVKQTWKLIINEFPKYKVVLAKKDEEEEAVLEFGDVMEKLKIGKHLSKKLMKDYEIITADNKQYTLWDVFVKAVEEVSKKEYKSDVHREKKIDKICQAIFEFSFALGI